jgi:glycyl-tRNA synthetase
VSESHYGVGGLRWWGPREIMLRRHAAERIVACVRDALAAVNPAWAVVETEGPAITPRGLVGPSYDGGDLWLLQGPLAGGEACLRPETTPSSYAAARAMLAAGRRRLPLCVWQAGRSYRRETNDGASPSKLRHLEFWQLEMQCLYAAGTKADYRAAVLPDLADELSLLTGRPARVVESDRLPTYSRRTTDVEVERPDGRWVELASVSERGDFAEGAPVLEVAVGLDRVVAVAEERRAAMRTIA